MNNAFLAFPLFARVWYSIGKESDIMKSIRSIYKIGNGPSSSHTVGPYNAAQIFSSRYPDADHFEVILYGSLALTGAGHGTEKAILSVIPDATVYADIKTHDIPHPNTMLFTAYKDGKEIGRSRVFSVGGGLIRFENETSDEEMEVYPQKNFTEIMQACRRQNLSLIRQS